MLESIYVMTFTTAPAEDTAEPVPEEMLHEEAYAYVPPEEPTPSPCACPCPLEARMKRLEERHDQLAQRFAGVMENHHLWDGS